MLLVLWLVSQSDYETIVTGTRTLRSRADAVVPTDVIKRQEIEDTGSENLGTLLEDYPGLDVSRTFAGAGVRIQGLDPQYVLILVDGERLPGRVNGTLDLTRLTNDDIERVEIVRGPASALYGSDALGGVINVITRKAKRFIESEAHLRYGYGTTREPLHAVDMNGKVASKLGDFNLKLTGGYHRQNAFDLDRSDKATTGNAFWQANVDARGAYSWGVNREVVFRSGYLRRDQQGIDVSGSGAVLARFNATENFNLSVAPTIATSDTGQVRAIVGYTLFRDQFLRDQVSSATPEYQENKQHLGQLQFVFSQRLSDHLLSVGLEGLFEQNSSQRLERTATRVRSGVYVQDEWQITRDPQVLVVPGVRLDGDTQFGAQPSPKIALRVDPLRNLALRASYGWGFRAPSFQELYLLFNNESVGYTVRGNANLRPEISQAINVGADYTPVEWLTLGINGYYNDLQNLITALAQTADATTGSLFTYANVARARTTGFESTAQVRPFEGVKLDLGYTLLDARDLQRQRRLDGRATHRFNFGVNYTHDGIGLMVMTRGTLVGDRVYYVNEDLGVASEPVTAAPYLSLDAKVAKRFARYLEVFVGVDNIMNAGQAPYLPLIPRMVYGGVTGRY